MTNVDRFQRGVLFAVELIDPVVVEPVSADVEIVPEGIAGLPTVNASGRFVWLKRRDDDQRWPGAVEIRPKRIPFEPYTEPARPRPGPNAKPSERLIRIMLRPTSSYPLAAGVTVVRGQLTETTGPDAAPVAGAYVQLAWRVAGDVEKWEPTPPEPNADIPEPATGACRTSERGAFVVFLRPGAPVDTEADDAPTPDLDKGHLMARLQFTRRIDGMIETRSVLVDSPSGREPPERGRIPEGQLVPNDMICAWDELE